MYYSGETGKENGRSRKTGSRKESVVKFPQKKGGKKVFAAVEKIRKGIKTKSRGISQAIISIGCSNSDPGAGEPADRKKAN